MANRNGFLYVLDRDQRQVHHRARPTCNQNWASAIGKDGKPIEFPGTTRPKPAR